MSILDKKNVTGAFSKAADVLQPVGKKMLTNVDDVRVAFCGSDELSLEKKMYHGVKSVALFAIFASSVVALNPEAIAASSFALGDELAYLEGIGEHAKALLDNKLG